MVDSATTRTVRVVKLVQVFIFHFLALELVEHISVIAAVFPTSYYQVFFTSCLICILVLWLYEDLDVFKDTMVVDACRLYCLLQLLE